MKSLNTFFGLLVFSASSFLNLPLWGEDEYVGYSDILITSTYESSTRLRYENYGDINSTDNYLNADATVLLVNAPNADYTDNFFQRQNNFFSQF